MQPAAPWAIIVRALCTLAFAEGSLMGRLDGRVAPVTGAGRGFGAAAEGASYLTGQALHPSGSVMP